MERSHFLRFLALGHPVEPGRGLAPRLQLAEPAPGALPQLRDVAELDRRGRTGLGARRRHVVLQTVVAERALVRRAGLELTLLGGAIDDAERTGRDAKAAAVADVLLDVDGAVLRANESAGGTRLQARRIRAVLADVGHHQPALVTPAVAIGLRLLDELHVTPRGGTQGAGVVVARGGQREAIGRQLVPLLAGNLAGLAPDAEACVGEESLRHFGRWRVLQVHQPLVGIDHVIRPRRTLQLNALSSWM